MVKTCKVSIFIGLLLSQVFGYPGDPMMYYSPYEARTINSYGPFNPSYQFQSMRSVPVPTSQRQLMHKNIGAMSPDHQDPQNFTISDLLDTINDVSHNEDVTEHFKAVTRDYDYMPYPISHPVSYNTSPKPSYGPQQPAYPSSAPAHHSSPAKFSFFKPELANLLVKPVTTKVASKVSGLLALVLTLLTGSAPDDLEVKGFKDIVINGILKPLLIAKGGIKSLISKLAIPVISLLLINLEVLVTVWWLWDECPVQKPTYNYAKPEGNYNSYR